MRDRYIKESDIIKMCEKAADTCHDLYMKSFEMAADKMRDFDFTAIAWFGQQERMYRYEIPSIIREVDGVVGFDEMNIEKSELSTRPKNVLLRAGYREFFELDGMSRNAFRKIKDMGKKSEAEIEKALKSRNMRIKDKDERKGGDDE
jgi:DNA-directed RNA polymerase alpha subunit